MSYFDNYIFQNRQENLLKEFNNLKLNKENSALGLKKAATSEETLINKSFDNPGGFSGYLRSYTLGLESDALNLPKNNPGMNRNPEGKRLLMNGNNSKAYNHGVSNGFNGYSRNYEEYITNCNHNSNQQLILKDAENKINIYNNNGFRSYFQEKNTSSYSDMNSLTRKIDDIYGKIFINHPLGKKI